jgi:[citrate (pro-3S)-lyase] ligase
MFNRFEIKELPLTVKSFHRKAEQFLKSNNLDMDNLDYYAGVFNDDTLLAGGGLRDDVIKCVAVAPEARELNLTNTLVSHLRTVGFQRGYNNLFVFTKSENEAIFSSLAFHVVGRAPQAILLESNPHGIKDYCKTLSTYKQPGTNAVIVMNCNPMTLGHRYLIETVANQVDALHIILVGEDKSEFSYADRLEMVRRGTADLSNVFVHEGGKYIISSATFPGYFLKSIDSITTTQIELDLDIFSRYIAPALNASIRFVGTEPNDLLTQRYNALMKTYLPEKDIEVIEIERLAKEAQPVSASQVRRLLKGYRLKEALALVPDTSRPFVINKCAEQLAKQATNALREELLTTPKPGLVDKDDNGAHTDMDLALMQKSIDTLHPFFIEIASTGLNDKLSLKEKAGRIKAIGIEAEEAMLQATGGVNTHRGAIFSMGLCVAAVAELIISDKGFSRNNLSEAIAAIAANYRKQQQSNGAVVCGKYNIQGALDNAQGGYKRLFSEILPVYQELRESEVDVNTANVKALLLIVSLLDDTNIYHRKGAEIAAAVKTRAADLYNDFTMDKVRQMNASYIRNRISPGGCADMLAVTIFLYEIIKERTVLS